MSEILIIGNGPAAHRLVERLRQHGHQGTITVLGAEKRPAYNRVLLASVLRRTLDPDAVTLPDLPAGTRVQLGVIATRIDRDRRLVQADDQVGYHYDELVLATGARPRIPDLPGVLTANGHLANGVMTLRTLADCERISEGAVVVLGGGALGVEAALGLLDSGHRVTLVHPHGHLMDRHLDATSGRLLADHLNKLGMGLQLGRKAVEYTLGKLFLDDGHMLDTDSLLLCTGVTPAAELARDADLAVRRGVVVDDRLRTNDPHIHAIGDCAEYAGTVPGLLDPAWDQAEMLATLLTGGHIRYRGTRPITRLKAPSIDVASLGSIEDLINPDAKVELVTLSDRARGRHAGPVRPADHRRGAPGFPPGHRLDQPAVRPEPARAVRPARAFTRHRCCTHGSRRVARRSGDLPLQQRYQGSPGKCVVGRCSGDPGTRRGDPCDHRLRRLRPRRASHLRLIPVHSWIHKGQTGQQPVTRTLVVIGHGMTGHHLVENLRTRDRADAWRVVILAEEIWPAYNRVALSSYLDGKSANDLSLASDTFLNDPMVILMLATGATGIDQQTRTVATADGAEIGYDALVLATGSRPFVPPVPGHDLPGCFVYRTLADLDAIRAAATEDRPAVVIGGGLLGLESANALRLLGMRPHIIEMASRPMPLQVDDGGGQLLARLIGQLGVRLYCGTATRSIDAGPDGRVCGVTLADGTTVDTDLVVFSTGVRPRDELAALTGLDRAERGGFLVDDCCRTSDSHVWAVGECAAVEGRCYGLVTPGYRMAEAIVEQLLGLGDTPFQGADTSTRLKLLGVEVASFGDAHAETRGALELTYSDNAAATYAKLVLSDDGRTLLGGILVGDASAYPVFRSFIGHELPTPPEQLLRTRAASSSRSQIANSDTMTGQQPRRADSRG